MISDSCPKLVMPVARLPFVSPYEYSSLGEESQDAHVPVSGAEWCPGEAWPPRGQPSACIPQRPARPPPEQQWLAAQAQLRPTAGRIPGGRSHALTLGLERAHSTGSLVTTEVTVIVAASLSPCPLPPLPPLHLLPSPSSPSSKETGIHCPGSWEPHREPGFW